MADVDPETQTMENVCLDMEMSRGMQLEHKTPFEKLENLEVQDEEGKSYKFGSLYKDQKTIIVFIRHFLCFMSKEYVEDLGIIPERYLQEAGVKLVVIGCGPHKFIKSYRQWTKYKGPLYVDTERKLYKEIGCLDKMKNGDVKVSRHVKSGLVMGILKSTWHGMKFCEMQGNGEQQGGSFIFGPGNEQHHAHIDQNTCDHVHINDLLAHAGVAQVNYPNDKRVMVI